jgi:hypothetical protein
MPRSMMAGRIFKSNVMAQAPEIFPDPKIMTKASTIRNVVSINPQNSKYIFFL